MTVTELDDKTALVLIDLQQGTLSAPTVPHAPGDVVGRAARLAEAFREAGAPVVLVRMVNAADGADAVKGRSEAARRAGAGGGNRRPHDLGPVADVLGGHPEDVQVTKRNWGAFYGTDLDLQLRRRGVTQIVLAGVATSLGVESTARAAHEHGYNVAFAVDAMTDINADAHAHSIAWVFPLVGELATTEEICELLGKQAS